MHLWVYKMKALQELLVIFIGFAIIYLIFDSIISSQKLKQYMSFFIGVCLLALSISTLLDEININVEIPSLNIPSIESDSNINGIWLSSEEGVKHSVKIILNKAYPDIKFTVSTHKTPQGLMLVYIGVVNSTYDLNDEIRDLINKKIGISHSHVNIYLAKEHSKEGANVK